MMDYIYPKIKIEMTLAEASFHKIFFYTSPKGMPSA